MLNVLIFVSGYLPGFKSGGPVRTISNLVAKLSGDLDSHIICRDRDCGDAFPYSMIKTNEWNNVDVASVFYLNGGIGDLISIYEKLCLKSWDVIYLNSFFSLRYSIIPLILSRSFSIRGIVLLGPRGEFSQGALSLKSAKKRIYLMFARSFGLYKNVVWHASTEHEADDIRRVMGTKAPIRVAVDIACPPSELAIQSRQANSTLRMVFLSRISPKKNLLGAIQMLQQVQCPVVFDVYGPVEDTAYWASCQEAARLLPTHVQFHYCGALYPAQVPETMARYDLFYLPTLGENFGHVIAEALGCGLPLLIADTTPWRDLAQQKLGWDIPLSQPERFVAAIESCSRMPAADYDAWRHSIRAWALANIGNDEAVEQNRQLFMNLDSAHEH